MRFSPSKGVPPQGSGAGCPASCTRRRRFRSGRAVRLLPKRRYSSAPATGTVRITSSHRILYAVSSRLMMINSTSSTAATDSASVMYAAYGDSHFTSSRIQSACTAAAGMTVSTRRSIFDMKKTPFPRGETRADHIWTNSLFL